jgi:hypothetical protein
MARNLTNGLQRGLRRSISGGFGAGDIFTIAPLDLRFAQQKTLDPRITFTRASSGTFVGSDGLIKTATTNEARFDHNPTTGESLGLLVEEQRTNLLLRSEELSNATWAKDFTVATADQATAPNGTLTADKVAEDSTTNFHAISQYVSGFASGAVASLSIYAKAAGRTKFRIQTDSTGGSGTADFDLSAVTATSGTGVFSAGSIQAVGDGWYCCSVRCTTSGAGAIGLKVILAATTYGTSYAGDGTSGIYLWGAQLEAGSFPTSYIPTTTATVTRSADVASITGANFSSWYRQDEGTVFAETRQLGDVLGFAFAVSDGTDNNRIAQFRNTTTLSSRNVRSGTAANPGNIAIASSQALVKSAIASIAGNSGAAANGVAATDSAPVAMPTVDRLQIALGAPGSTPINGTIRRFTYWPTRLSNSTLQEITR